MVSKRTTITAGGNKSNSTSSSRTSYQQQHQPTSTTLKSDESVNWRGDRLKSKSDWTIHVVRSDDGSRDIYYVHTKVVDDLSPRRVPYFEPIFKDSMRQIGDRTSELTVPSEVAEVFDKLLDFLYCSDRRREEEFLFNVKNGLGLYKVAEYFHVEPLQAMLTKFYRDQTMPFHVMDGSPNAATMPSTRGKKVLVSGERSKNEMEKFARSMHELEFVDETKLEPAYLLKTLKRRKEMNLTESKRDSENISCLVALCTKHYREKMTRSFFYKLTQESFIPHIDQEAALQLLTVETELGFWTDTDNFSTVQARCIQSLLSDWKGLRRKFDSDGAFWKTLRGLSPNVLGILLMQSTRTSQGNSRSSSTAGSGRDQPPL
ncbi:BTB/POZ domain containing protein [Nitzschia inconspicua]|uniref:BTB/POZ domain containing protein n=1 Tax=Nitzschia inconspicua TaxID=303405 RepID=A0A9K3LS01_9STRA|nr:BTB/POZ domain containing protein [Nitzschia inconspicua]